MASPLVLGLDLGTTNVGLAHGEAEGEAPPSVFPIPQVIHAGEVAARDLLPSFLYLPGEVELPAGSLALPWDPDRGYAVGAFAREQGARVPSRLVSSAKSWLSHAGADRRAPILPWEAPEEVAKVSPVEATSRYLAHVKEAWNEAHPGSRLEDQDLVLTVPASFDAVARELTVEAAHAAGIGAHLTLLEEPQAALYAWVASSGGAWRKQVHPGDLILVCDVGGGTVDFSLIAVLEEEGTLQLSRVAVGDHILLGGDNMDLALAFAVRARLEAEGKALDDWQLRALTHGCRVAKEALFAVPSLDEAPVVIPGRGSKLIGGTIRTELRRAELEATLVDGFFPRVGAADRPAAPRRLGLTALGLPYAHDPAITRHLAAFLGRQAGASASLPPGVHAEGRTFLHPTALLFNGGVTKAGLLRERVVEVLDSWIEAEGGRKVAVLEGGDPDLAVAKGAAYFGRVRRGVGLRIRGGTARSYYVGMERAELAVPGVPPRIDAVCVAPFGMEEGSETRLPDPLGLLVGEPAAFRFFASSTRRDDTVGEKVDPAELEELTPIETTLHGEQGQVVPVELHAKVTEVGTLELSAVEQASGQRWKLEYDVRGA
ncbi:MAG TPA: Hsp70 family protein [Vulgatibacter sp.]|nr:Hsp70 family protein [Vulgatibacter sp.]